MLKKHNKLILLLVLATFMFSIVGSASAATFSDVSGDPVQTSAIYKLNALGIIDGYPDGTFGPEKTISRAEFAKIAVNMAGLQSVASGMANTASVFKDINSGDWFNGFVNVAAAQGYVKGDPTGNFRPNDQITQGEVITVLMRLLGYNDNLTGDWPADYISKAANLEILKNITFVANKAATRADVASMGSETLDKYVVEYKADSNTFESAYKPEADIFEDGSKNKEITYTLQQDKFKGGMTEDALVERFVVPQDENDKYELEYYTYDEDDDWTKGSVTLAKSFVVANGKSIIDTSGKFVDFIVNDDDEAVFIAINDYGTVKDDAMTCKGSKQNMTVSGTVYSVYSKVELNDKDYDFAKDVVWIPNAKGVPYMQMKDNKEEAADWYTATLNDDGDIACVTVTTQPSPGIVDYVNAERETISFKNPPQGCLTGLGTSWGNKVTDLSNKTYFVTRNGVPAKLADIAEDDALLVYSGQNDYAEGGFSGVDYFIIAIDSKLAQIKGKVSAVEPNADGSLKKVTVGDKEYKVVNSTNFATARDLFVTDNIKVLGESALPAAYGALAGQYLSPAYAAKIATNAALAPSKVQPYISTDGGDDFELIPSAEYISGGNYDLLDEEVTLVMTPNGRVGTIISDVDNADTGKVWGVIIQKVAQTTKGSDLVSMIKIVNKEDKEISYAIDDDTTLNGVDKTISEIYAAISLGDMVAVTLTGEGNIDNIKTTDIKTTTVSGASNVDDDLDSIKLTVNGVTGWYSAKDVVVFNYTSPAGSADADADIMKWSDVQDTILNSASLTFNYYLDGNEVDYIAVKDAAMSTDTNYAVFVKSGKDSTDPYAVVLIGGKEEKYYLNNEVSYTNAKGYKKGNLIAFKWEGNDMKVTKKSDLLSQIIGGTYAEVTDVKVKSNIVEVNKVAYLVDEDTVVYDSTNHDALKQLTLNDVSRGDNVYAVYDKDSKILAAIVITDADDAKDVFTGSTVVNPTTSVSVKLTATASGIGQTASVTTTGYTNVTQYKLYKADGTALTDKVAIGTTTTVMFLNANDSVKVELYKADGTLADTKTVTATAGTVVTPTVTVTLANTASGIGKQATVAGAPTGAAQFKLSKTDGTALTGLTNVGTSVTVMFLNAGDQVKVDFVKADGTALSNVTVTAN